MRSILAIGMAVSVFALACSESSKGTPRPDAADCGCHFEGSGPSAVLVMSWSCYCAAYGDDCTRKFASQCTEFRQRLDYPLCGLTVLRVVPAGGPIDDVYDCNGNLVGARIASDTSAYVCPSDPTMTAFRASAGLLPPATCSELDFGVCSASSATCGDGGDGGAGP